jgi:O-antigen/teichoic acid export membrane protein
MSLTKRVFNNIFWLTFSEIVSKLLIFLGILYLARVLGKAGFGLFSLSMATAMYFLTVTDVGLPTYGTREIARNKEKTAELYSVLNSLRFFLAISLIFLFAAILYFISMPLEKKLILLAGAFYAIGWALSADWVFRGLEKMQYIVIGRVAGSLLFLSGVLLLVKSFSDTVLAAIIYSFTFLIGSLILLFLLGWKFSIPFYLRISFKKWKLHIKESIFLALNIVFNRISIFIPIYFMGLWSTHEELGLFSAPHRLAIIITESVGLIMTAFFPTLSNLYVTDKEAFKETNLRLLKLIIISVMPMCIIATVFSQDIIILLFGSVYIESTKIFNILIWFSFLMTIRRIYGNGLISAGFHRFNIIATGSGMFIIILLGLFLIPKYNGYGAVFSLIIGEIFTLILMAELFRTKIQIHSDLLKTFLMRFLIATMVMIVVIKNQFFSLALSTVLGIVIYGIMLIVTGIISKEKILQLYQRVFEYLVR